ncbi:MAG: leucine-rich repeat domain-containing protein, partial [Bacteroidaceae bacterium]|nr:leucine-rich repeat domain-containing protein [Bacteroidaceae bacterium]
MHKYIFLLFLSFSTTSFAYDFESDGLYYNIVDNEMWDVDYLCVEVTYDDESDNQGSTQSVTSVVVPATVEYAETLYHVIGIGQRTFIAGHYPRLSSLVLPEGLLYIDDNAIGGRKLPLKSIIIPNTVTTIGAGVFEHSNIESIVLPSSVTYLGNHAFLDCNSLEFVSLSENIQTINSTTFVHCDNLRTVIIPEGVIRIDDS